MVAGMHEKRGDPEHEGQESGGRSTNASTFRAGARSQVQLVLEDLLVTDKPDCPTFTGKCEGEEVAGKGKWEGRSRCSADCA